MTQVAIKRLDHCFNPTPRYKKIDSILAYLNMFPEHLVKGRGLSQFDEVAKPHYKPGLRDSIMNGTITDAEIEQFMEEADLPELVGRKYVFSEIQVPKRATSGAAGFDLQAAIDTIMEIPAGTSALVPTGLCVKLPDNLELQVRPRSGLAAKSCITVLNSPGTVDSDYTGEIKVILINHSKEAFTIKRGDRIAQAVFNEVALPTLVEVEDLEKTERGESGFGSTGK
jgi:dUTP pyrophosphatase